MAQRIAPMEAHYAIVAFRADKARFSATLRVVIDMADHARGQIELLANLLFVKVAGEVDPFAAVCRPRLPAIRFRNAAGKYGLFKLSEMLANHG